MSDCAVQNREALYRFPAGQLQVGYPRGCCVSLPAPGPSVFRALRSSLLSLAAPGVSRPPGLHVGPASALFSRDVASATFDLALTLHRISLMQ